MNLKLEIKNFHTTMSSVQNEIMAITFDLFQCIENILLYLDVAALSLLQFLEAGNIFEKSSTHAFSKLFSMLLAVSARSNKRPASTFF